MPSCEPCYPPLDAAVRQAVEGSPELAASLVDLTNSDVAQIYDTQLEIEKEATAVRIELAALERNLTSVAAAVRHVSEALKQLGDFENYIEVVGRLVEQLTVDVAVQEATPRSGGERQQEHG